MKLLLIGHRGVGKSSLLQRLQIYGRGGFAVFDLDREIEKEMGCDLVEYFAKQGEASFRSLEKATLASLLKKTGPAVISLGAGFPMSEFDFPSDVEICWVRRLSDQKGRVFHDRPRLNPEIEPLQEFRLRADRRAELYRDWSDWTYWMPEGLSSPDEIERRIFGDRLEDIGGMLTLQKSHFRNFKTLHRRTLRWGVDAFELRQDLLSEAQAHEVLSVLPPQKVLVSIRKLPVSAFWQEACRFANQVDWALELGPPPSDDWAQKITCVSNHSLDAKVFIPYAGLHWKFSPVVTEFQEIEKGLSWQTEDPDRRSFLPRSEASLLSGRWSWVRLLLKDRQRFNFFKDSDGSALDQPTLHEWVRALSRPQKFFALLGDPVDHSFSPIEQASFAKSQQASFFPIQVATDEFNQAWSVITKWGMVAAAVTSPLKERAFAVSEEFSARALERRAVNTLSLSGSAWRGDNTDEDGLREALEIFGDLGATLVWGGGGTLEVLKSVLRDAQFWSVRQGAPRDGATPFPRVETVIWAAGPRDPEPPGHYRPRRVVDLNYREDSRAKEFALKTGSPYFSGEMMFRMQAAHQRKVWEKYVRSSQ